jgi:hypothetical protein
MHKPSTNKKKLTARALEPEQPRENQKLSFMFIFIFVQIPSQLDMQGAARANLRPPLEGALQPA